MILREMLSLLEGKNHMGEDEQTTYAGWKRACKKVNPDVWFEGDADIAQAMVGPKPYKQGETKSIGEWDGAKGCVYNHAKKAKKLEEARKRKPESMGAESLYYYIKDKCEDREDEETADALDAALGGLHVEDRSDRAEAKDIMLDFIQKHAWLNEGLTEAKNGPKSRGEKFQPGWYVVDEDDVPFHGPFQSEHKANVECTHLGGAKRGYTIDYVESLKEGEIDQYEAWQAEVRKKYSAVAKQIKFKSNPEGNVEALIPGEDRLYGIFDVEKNEGMVLEEGKLDEKRMQWHDSDAPDAEGKFKELGVQALGDWLIKTRNGDMKRINGSLVQQKVMNRKRDPEYAKKMDSVREYVKTKLKKD